MSSEIDNKRTQPGSTPASRKESWQVGRYHHGEDTQPTVPASSPTDLAGLVFDLLGLDPVRNTVIPEESFVARSIHIGQIDTDSYGMTVHLTGF